MLATKTFGHQEFYSLAEELLPFVPKQRLNLSVHKTDLSVGIYDQNPNRGCLKAQAVMIRHGVDIKPLVDNAA